MVMTFIREKSGGCRRLLLCLMLAVIIAAEWVGAGHGEAGIQGTNSSGNWNVKLSVDPFRFNERYSAVLYDNRSGLPTSEANAIAQTSEGFIWIGSYAGLIRYDGNTFELFDSTAGISNVRCLYVDSQDRLWIGTNDSGVFLMRKGEVRKWNKENGLKSVSIRALAEDADGIIYVASVAGVAMIDAELNLTFVEDERIAGQTIRDIRCGGDNLIYGLTEAGDLFTLKDGDLLTFLGHDECRVEGVLAIFPDPKRPGDLYLGTENSQIYYGNLEHNFASMGMKDISPLNYVERFEAINGQIWICAGNGIGKVDAEGFHALRNVPMNNSVGHVMTDYEGNLWFTSTRQGVMKIVPNQFSDLFERYNLPAAVVNSTCMYGRQLFIGTDSGLIVIEDGRKANSIPLTRAVTASGVEMDTTDLLEYLNGVRIRSIIRDSRGRLWIATWRKYGLIRYDQGEVVRFTPEDGLFSDRVRMVSECEDGSMLVANTGGVNVIEDDRVTAGYGKEDGIAITEILSVIEGYNHDLILGSDGGGIYVIGPGGTKHIGTDEGLSSEVILRVKRSSSQDIYWIVTGNSLAYMTPDYQVFTIREFPYSNNYDLYENSKGDAWVISSNGIYETPTEELLTAEPIKPVFHGIANGLPYVATANSFSELTPEGDLYISSSVGVVKVNIEKPFENISALKVALPYIDADGERIYSDDAGNYTIPASTRKLTVYPRVFNYLLVNPRVSYRLEGFDSADTTVSRQELVPVDYTNLPNGTYQFVMLIEDPAGHADKTVSFQIVKGKEASVGAAGNIIINTAALFFMAGILIYTSLYRERGRLDDRLFFAMIISNMVVAAADEASGLLEGSAFLGARPLMIAVNMVSFIGCAVFPYLLLLYLDYRVDQDTARIRRMKMVYGIPCFLLILLQVINLKTGWIFFIGKDNIYHFGVLSDLVFLPVAFYYLLSLIRVRRLDVRLIFPGILLIVARVCLGIWIRDIFSTAFVHTALLVCIHICVMNRPLREEEP